MQSSYLKLQVNCSLQKPSISHNFDHFKSRLSSAFKPLLGELQQLSLRISVPKTIKNSFVKLLDVFVDQMFEFVDQPLLPSQRNFAPVDALREAVLVTNIDGEIPEDFPEGPNPLFGGLKSTKSMFGSSNHIWVEGEGMLHALYFKKETDGSWNVVYMNRHVESETFKQEKQRNRSSFLPAIEGDSLAILSAYLLNLVGIPKSLRFGKINKYISNTNIFEHAGKFYSVAENHMPQEIDIFTLETLADGDKLVHKVDLKLSRCSLCHEIGITQRYNVFLDYPLSIDLTRLAFGGPLIKYEHEGYAKIGIMPRYGDADSVKWFDVEPNCTFHIINCFEDGNEVIVWGCRALESIIPGPDLGLNKFEWFSKKFRHAELADESVDTSPDDVPLFSRVYEWRLNMQNGDVKETNLSGTKVSMDFPMINGGYTGIKNKYGYTQIVDSIASSASGMPKYGGLAKLSFEEPDNTESEELIKVEYHKFEENIFCTGGAFVPKGRGVEEDDGWIITFLHNEDTNISQVYIIDTKKFTDEPVAKITLSHRVPYGFHGAFMSIPVQTQKASRNES
ncbi:hypothetical protein KPL71_000407 [Citrus sinensis]|uniref:Uncharacterized protein n=1 Tax=Citrus sinensis TaxID=2711 RepID=A0ACB8NP36_CITSI|nr:hypothetical protein KPL71_000407 [Citrus sinensis]